MSTLQFVDREIRTFDAYLIKMFPIKSLYPQLNEGERRQ